MNDSDSFASTVPVRLSFHYPGLAHPQRISGGGASALSSAGTINTVSAATPAGPTRSIIIPTGAIQAENCQFSCPELKTLNARIQEQYDFPLVDRFDNNVADIPPYDPQTPDQGNDPAQGRVFQGGNLQGITPRRLDHIKGLGANTVWLSPVLKNKIEQPFL